MSADAAGFGLVGRIVRWISFAALVTLLSVYVLRRPLVFRAPATVLSNSHPVQRANEPYLLFLQAVRHSVPAGAAIVLVGADDVDSLGYLALGQLPKHRLLPPAALGRSERDRQHLPMFVASYGAVFRDERYQLRDQFPTGNVYEIRR